MIFKTSLLFLLFSLLLLYSPAPSFQSFSCNGTLESSSDVCSGRGSCIGTDTCICLTLNKSPSTGNAFVSGSIFNPLQNINAPSFLLKSTNGRFSFHFRESFLCVKDATTDQNIYQTPSYPTALSFGYKVSFALEATGNLKLTLQSDGSTLWQSNTINLGRFPYYLLMLDDGNLVLYDSVKAKIWETNSSVPGLVYTNTTGQFCESHECFGVLYNETNVCSGNGTCTAFNTCQCKNGHYGANCELYKCHDILGNETNVCGGHGKCVGTNQCACNYGYDGPKCQETTCGGISSYNIESVCSGHGLCTGFNQCTCLDFNSSLIYNNNSLTFPNTFNQTNYLISSNNRFKFMIDDYGNGTIYDSQLKTYKQVWKGIPFTSPYQLIAYSNGFLEAKNNNSQIMWGSNAEALGFPPYRLLLQSDGNLVITYPGGLVWTSKTGVAGLMNDYLYGGENCQMKKCYGILSNDTNVCSGHGECIGPDNCVCQSGWRGSSNCSVYTCDSLNNCNNHGVCVGNNTCSCQSGWRGSNNCSIFTCDSLNNCNDHGICIGNNTCSCQSGWLGANNCSKFSCEERNYCGTNGTCIGPNECHCKDNWFGSNCTIPSCFGILANESSVCGGKGQCQTVNSCKCDDGYFGHNCTIPVCYGALANEVNACNGHGSCLSKDHCKCDSGWYGDACSVPNCYGTLANNSLVCGGNGQCMGPDFCKCNSTHGGANCNIPYCYGVLANETSVCGGHGSCSNPNTCECQPGWKGNSNCSIASCEYVNNCSGNGTCIGPNQCLCKNGFQGSNDCSVISCVNVNHCSNHGYCSGPDQCTCDSGWKGNANCSSPSCENVNYCSNRGYCLGPNLCACGDGWKGNANCSSVSCELLQDCNGKGTCIGSNQCECLSGWKGSLSCSVPSCENLSNCNGNGVCSKSNVCSCFERYGSYDCKFLKLLSSEILINGKLDGIEKVTTFSLSVKIDKNVSTPIFYNYYIPNVLNQTTQSENCNVLIQSKGSYPLTVTIYSAERPEFIHGNQMVTLNVAEFKDNSLADLNVNDIYDIAKNDDVFKSENKTAIINQLVSATKKEIITTVDQGEKALFIYETVVKYSNIPVSNNITSQINQISNVLLESKKNGTTTDYKIETSVSSIFTILDNILQQTNSSSTISDTNELKSNTERTIQTSLSLLSLSSSISNKRIEGKAMNLLFKRISNETKETNLNITSEYQFKIPTNNNLNEGNVSYGAVMIGDSQLYKTSDVSLSNVFQLKTFVNGNYVPLRNLKNPITISFKLEKGDISFNSSTSYSCKYFNEEAQEWRTDGCKSTGYSIVNGFIVMNCECDHTTSFLTFLEFSSKSNNTSVAQIVLSSIYLIIIILIFIGLLVFRKEPIVKSRFLTPYIGLLALFIDNLFSGIISNAIFQQTKIYSTSTTQSAADILGNVAVIISTMMTLIAIGTYLIEIIRYLLVRYLYELLNENPKIEKKPLLKLFTSKLIYIISCFTIGIPVIIYFVIFVILRRFDVISAIAFSSITTITFFVLIILFSVVIFTVFGIDIYFTTKYKQFTNELTEMMKKNVTTETDNNNNKKFKKFNHKNYQNILQNFFVYNDNLLFRSEACIFLFGLIFFIISFCIGFSLLAKEGQKDRQQLSEVILAFDLIRNVLWITLFGGYIVCAILYKKVKNVINQKSTATTNKKTTKEEENKNEDDITGSLTLILKQNDIFSLFKQYAKQEFSLENVYAFADLEYIKDLQKKNKEDEIWKELDDFKLKYLEANTNMELNVSSELKKSVNKNLKERKELKNLLEDIESAIVINLGDTYSRFIETEEYLLLERINELKEQIKN